MKQQKTKELPKGWKSQSFSKCFKPISPTNKIPKSNYLDKGNLPVVDQGDGLIAGYIQNNSKKQKITLPAIIFGDHTRRFKLINFDFVAGADGIKILQINDFLDPKFAYYQCLILHFPNKGYSRHFQYLNKTSLIYPESLSSQQLIVSAIETEFTRLDETIKSLKTVKQKIEIYRKAVLKKAFEEGEEIALGKAFEIIMGQSPPSEFYNKNGKGLPFFQGKKEFRDKYPKIEVWTEKYNKEAGKGDLLLSIRAPIGPCNIAPEKCAIGRGIATIKARNETESLLLFYLISHKGQELDSKGTGTTFKAISKTGLNSFIVKLPKKEDWKKIISLIESKFSVIDKVEEIVNNSLKKAEHLRKSILKVAFEGRLVK